MVFFSLKPSKKQGYFESFLHVNENSLRIFSHPVPHFALSSYYTAAQHGEELEEISLCEEHEGRVTQVRRCLSNQLIAMEGEGRLTAVNLGKDYM